MATASSMKSLLSLRPKPPPMRVMWMVTASSGIPNCFETAVRAAPGNWVGDQISQEPFSTRAIELPGTAPSTRKK